MTRRALHFLALGALLFALDAQRGSIGASGRDADARAVIEVSAADRAALAAEFRARFAEDPAPEELAALLRAHVDQEILVREALGRGLQHGDPVIRRRLARNLEFVASDPKDGVPARGSPALARRMEASDLVVRRRLVQRMEEELRAASSAPDPSEAEIDAWLRRQAAELRIPARFDFSQVFLSAEERGPLLARDAARLRERLVREKHGPESALARGDPLGLPRRMGPVSERDIGLRFGGVLARGVARAEPHAWVGPLASAYGLHLVWVHERLPETLPPPEIVRARAARALRAQREEVALRAGLATLRERYDVRGLEKDLQRPGSPGS